jgi:hypothetical protein
MRSLLLEGEGFGEFLKLYALLRSADAVFALRVKR